MLHTCVCVCENKVHSLLSIFHIILDVHYFVVLVQKNGGLLYLTCETV